MNPTVPFRLVDDPFFCQAFGHPFSRHNLGETIYTLAEDIRKSVEIAIRGSVVALALDGWTKWSHEKFIDFVILWNGKAIFRNTIPAKYGKSSQNLMALLTIAVASIEARFSVTVGSIVADNENANSALFGLVRDWRTWIICIGCAAHGLQLVLQDTFK
eukprot:EG_transcript_27408